MSFIVTARLITRGCRSRVSSFNFNSITRKICSETNYFKMTTPLMQKRGLCDKKEMKINTDSDLERIYYGTLATKIRVVKYFSLTTSFCTLAVQPYLIPKLLEAGGIAAPLSVGALLCFFTFVTPMLLHFFTNKYVVEIFYNKRNESYIASTYTFFARLKKIEFTPDDVEKPGMGQMLTNCYVRGRPLLMDFANFTDPQHYAIIMGYDKPIDFRFETDAIAKKDSHEKVFKQTNQMNEKTSMRN